MRLQVHSSTHPHGVHGNNLMLYIYIYIYIYIYRLIKHCVLFLQNLHGPTFYDIKVGEVNMALP